MEWLCEYSLFFSVDLLFFVSVSEGVVAVSSG